MKENEMKKSELKQACCALALVLGGMGGSHAATDPQSAVSASMQTDARSQTVDPAWQVKSRHGAWVVLCKDSGSASNGGPTAAPAVGGASPCRAVQTLDVKVGNTQQRLLSLSLTSKGDGLAGEFVLPFGLDLQQGMGLRIDEGDAMTARFATCLPAGCVVRVELSRELSRSLIGSRQLRLAFRPLGSDKSTVTELSSQGLAEALGALATR